jgi:hypothetical protein
MLNCEDCLKPLANYDGCTFGENDSGKLRPYCLKCADARFEEADPRCYSPDFNPYE